MRCKTKQSKTEKTKSVLHAGKHRICTQKMRKSKYIIFLYFFFYILYYFYTKNKTELQNTRIHSIVFWTGEVLLKFIIGIFFM